MTEEKTYQPESALTIVKRVAKKTALLVIAAVAVSLVLNKTMGLDPRWWFLPASVVFGGALGLLNFRWLSVAVERVYLRKETGPGAAKAAAMIIHVLKLSAIFVILFIVIRWRLINVFGLVAGLSLCFFAILWEGFGMMKRARIRS